MKSNTPTTIRNRLLLLALSAILPLFLFSVALLGYISSEKSKSLESGIKSTAKVLTTSVEEQISSIELSLKILAAIEDFDEENLQFIHRRLKRFVSDRPGWSSIGLAKLDGTQVFSTIRNFGEELPNWNGDEFFDRAISTKSSAVSNYRIGRLLKTEVISIGVPVIINKELKYILVATIHAHFFSELLNKQNFPTTWTALIVDGQAKILAHSKDPKKFVGTEALGKAYYLKQLSAHFHEDFNNDGISSFISFFKTKNSQWRVVVVVPESELYVSTYTILRIFVLGGGLLLILGIILTQKFGRDITYAIQHLSDAARSLGQGRDPGLKSTTISEVNVVYEELEKAYQERDQKDKVNAELYERSQEAVEARDNFLSMASHELKTPLTSLSLQVQIIKKILDDKDDLKKEMLPHSLKLIMNQLRRLTQLIDDLLDVTRIQAGQIEIKPQPMDMEETFKSVVEQFQRDFPEIPIHLSSEKITGQFDRNRIEQIVTNLISNAIKYGEKKPITITLTRIDGKVKFTVIDQGKGIEMQDKDRIFDRFERVGNNSGISGIGLGLWIVQKIIDNMNGKIEVISEGMGKGTTFEITLPHIKEPQ